MAEPKDELSEQLLIFVLEKFDSNVCGTIDDNCVRAAVSYPLPLVVSLVTKEIYRRASRANSAFFQLMTALSAKGLFRSDIAESIFELCASANTFYEVLVELLNSVETFRFVSSMADDANSEVLAEMDPSVRSIWDTEPMDVPEKGTFNQMIIYLTSGRETVDIHTYGAFLATYKSYATPQLLLRKLVERWNVPKKKASKKEARTVQKEVCNFLQFWLITSLNRNGDFSNRTMAKDLEEFLEEALKRDSKMTKMLKQIRVSLNKVMEQNAAEEQSLETEMVALAVAMDPVEHQATFYLGTEVRELARQLTLYDSELFRRIVASELLNKNWTSSKSSVTAPNVLALIERFNEVSFWVATSILNENRPGKRRKVVEQMLLLATEFQTLNNFHGLMSVLAGLMLSPVARLKKTFAKVDRNLAQRFEEFKSIMSPLSSYKAYRGQLNQVPKKEPCLPYLGTILSDLTFLEDGNPTFAEPTDPIDPIIYFGKFSLVADQLSTVRKWQDRTYKHPVVPRVYNAVVSLPHYPREKLHSMSLALVPR